jgi:hypothetical protein
MKTIDSRDGTAIAQATLELFITIGTALRENGLPSEIHLALITKILVLMGRDLGTKQELLDAVGFVWDFECTTPPAGEVH